MQRDFYLTLFCQCAGKRHWKLTAIETCIANTGNNVTHVAFGKAFFALPLIMIA